MLKNKNNGVIYTQWYVIQGYNYALITKNHEYNAVIGRILRFIEQHPLKIVKINVEAF